MTYEIIDDNGVIYSFGDNEEDEAITKFNEIFEEDFDEDIEFNGDIKLVEVLRVMR